MNGARWSGPHLNINIPFTSIGIPMLKIRRSPRRLIFNMGVPMHTLKDVLYIETGPCFQVHSMCRCSHTTSISQHKIPLDVLCFCASWHYTFFTVLQNFGMVRVTFRLPGHPFSMKRNLEIISRFQVQFFKHSLLLCIRPSHYKFLLDDLNLMLSPCALFPLRKRIAGDDTFLVWYFL